MHNFTAKWNKRFEQLENANFNSFKTDLKQFLAFFDNEQILIKIWNGLQISFPDSFEVAYEISNGFNIDKHFEKTGDEFVALTINLLKQINENKDHIRPQLERIINFERSTLYRKPQENFDEETLDLFKRKYLSEFSVYFEEQIERIIPQIEKESGTLKSLLRYKHRSEWFNQSKLLEIYTEETKNKNYKAEKRLAFDLYSYLYDQGIDFYIEPSSIRGAIDLISIQKPNDPLLADTKIFDGASRGKQYICKGYNQVYNYTRQFNQPSGYLIIFKVTKKDLSFSIKTDSRNVPFIIHNSKTIFIITIDLHEYDESVSKRKAAPTFEITEKDLIHYIENSDD